MVIEIRTVVASWETEKRPKGTFWGVGNILYLERGVSYVGVCICQN